jgi:transaldolase
MAHPKVEALTAQGQSIWQDDITRGMLISGTLKRTIAEVGIRGLTSNPTIFEKAISGGNDYDAQIGDLLVHDKTPLEIFEALAVQDIRDACDLFRGVYDASNGTDGFCSIEVSPDAARDADSTRTQVRRLWSSVNRPNLLVKIPGTIEGAPVIEEMLTEGININITLLFSIQSYERVANAFVSALEKRHAAGQPIDRISSVASFFVSRVDTLVDKLLDEKIAATSDAGAKAKLEALKGKIAIANAKLAYEKFQQIFGGERFAPLKAAGAQVQRPLWASTGTKNPAYSDTLYVDTLIGPDTVNTMPSKTIAAFLDHGTVARTVERDLATARQQMADLAAAGIEIAAVTAQLEEEGIASFTKSFESLLAGVESKKGALAAATA